MTEPQNPERIDGEHHYAEQFGPDLQWAICRKSDGVIATTVLDKQRGLIRTIMGVKDANANHFLELGRAEGRRKANLDELSRLGQEAEKDYGPTAGASEVARPSEGSRVAEYHPLTTLDDLPTDELEALYELTGVQLASETSPELHRARKWLSDAVYERKHGPIKKYDGPVPGELHIFATTEPPTATPDTDELHISPHVSKDVELGDTEKCEDCGGDGFTVEPNPSNPQEPMQVQCQHPGCENGLIAHFTPEAGEFYDRCGDCGGSGEAPYPDPHSLTFYDCESCKGTGKANPSPPTQPDQAKKTDQNFSSPENSKETLPVPIQGEGPYRAESAPKVGWDIYGPDGHERRLHEITIPTYVNDLNAAYQAGANSTNQQTFDIAKRIGYAQGLVDGEISHPTGESRLREAAADIEIAIRYWDGMPDEGTPCPCPGCSALRRVRKFLATTTPSPNEAEIRADERRRIDESIERFQDGEFTVAIAEKGGWCVIDPPLGDCSGLPSLGNGDSPLRAILAATQSIQAEAGDGA